MTKKLVIIVNVIANLINLYYMKVLFTTYVQHFHIKP